MDTGDVAQITIQTHVYMTKFIFFRERRVQGTRLSGSKSRCSITSIEGFLLIDGKKRRRGRFVAFLKRFWPILRKVIDFIFALGFIAKLLLLIASWFGW